MRQKLIKADLGSPNDIRTIMISSVRLVKLFAEFAKENFLEYEKSYCKESGFYLILFTQQKYYSLASMNAIRSMWHSYLTRNPHKQETDEFTSNWMHKEIKYRQAVDFEKLTLESKLNHP